MDHLKQWADFKFCQQLLLLLSMGPSAFAPDAPQPYAYCALPATWKLELEMLEVH
jgi:hypothetical protein